MRLQARGLTRRALRGAKTPRRMLLFALGGVIIVLWLGPSLFMQNRLPPSDPQRIRTVAPFALLGICLLTLISSAGDRAISFTPGEVDMLFPGPFTRRQLIVFKLTKSTCAAALSALFLSFFLQRHAKWWPACYVGVLLTLLFIQFFSINAVLIAQTVGTAVASRWKTGIAIATVIVGAMVARHLSDSTNGGDLLGWMKRIDAVPAAHLLLLPFALFGWVITAAGPVELAKLGTIAVAIDAGLLALAMRLDENYLEAATVASARRSAQLQRIRGGAMLSMGVGRGEARWHVPQPPLLGGAGPIAWRQFTNAFRSAKGLLFLLVILAVGASPLLSTRSDPTRYATTFISVIVWLTVMVSTLLKFDFRGDIDLMDFLKSLPIRPWLLAAGQLVTPTLLIAATHLAILALAARMMPQYRTAFISAAVLVLPVDLILVAVENLIFLLFPTRPAAASPGDFQILGRQSLVLAGKMFSLLILAGPPLAIALLIYVLSGKSLVVFTTLAAGLMIAELAGLLVLIGWAFVRFDPSIHTPA
jgi:hypothetical protein